MLQQTTCHLLKIYLIYIVSSNVREKWHKLSGFSEKGRVKMAKKVEPKITVRHLGDEKALVNYYVHLLQLAAKEKRMEIPESNRKSVNSHN